MARKKEEFDFEFDATNFPQEDGETVDVEIPTKEWNPLRSLEFVTWRNNAQAIYHENGDYYLVPVGRVIAPDKLLSVSQDDSEIIRLYTWDKEIDAMLPSREEMVKLVRLALYRNGALQKGDLKKNEVARNATRHAFPYVIKEIEE